MIQRGNRMAEYKLWLIEFLQKMGSHLLCRYKENEIIFCENKHVDKAHAIPNHQKKLGIISCSKD